jgi:hypothetical protein
MNLEIEAIFLDLGDTLRILVKDEEYMARARRRIVDLLGTDEDPNASMRIWKLATKTIVNGLLKI